MKIYTSLGFLLSIKRVCGAGGTLVGAGSDAEVGTAAGKANTNARQAAGPRPWEGRSGSHAPVICLQVVRRLLGNCLPTLGDLPKALLL